MTNSPYAKQALPTVIVSIRRKDVANKDFFSQGVIRFRAAADATVRNMVEWKPVRSSNSGANIIAQSTSRLAAVNRRTWCERPPRQMYITMGIKRKLSQIKMGRKPYRKLLLNISAEKSLSAGSTYSGYNSRSSASRWRVPGASISSPQPIKRNTKPTIIQDFICLFL